jgi:hypothetical protein
MQSFDTVDDLGHRTPHPPGDGRSTAGSRFNNGAPLNQDGIDMLLHSPLSRKFASRIGRFGIGLKPLRQRA